MTLPQWCKRDPGRAIVRIEVHLQPNARTTEVAGTHGDALKIRVAAPPLDQRANEMLMRFIAQRLDVPPARLRIARGEKSRSKSIEISGVDDALTAQITRLAPAI